MKPISLSTLLKERADADFTGGLSYNFSKMFIGIRYNQGFVDVTKDNSQSILGGSGKNSVTGFFGLQVLVFASVIIFNPILPPAPLPGLLRLLLEGT